MTDKPNEMPDVLYMKWPEGGYLGQTMDETETKYTRADLVEKMREALEFAEKTLGDGKGNYEVYCRVRDALKGNE